MSDTAHRVGMATLYELSLAIGHTPDPYTTSRDFLRVLVAHCGFAGAEIWWRDPASQEGAAALCLLGASPERQSAALPPAASALFEQTLAEDAPRSFSVGQADFPRPDPAAGPLHPFATLIPLDGKGLLLLHADSADTLSCGLVEQLQVIIARLCTALQGGMAFIRLQASEKRLRETSRRLAETKRISEQYAEQLANAHTHLHTLIRNLPDLVWLKDAEGVYLSCNNRFERCFGAPEQAIVGKTDYDFIDTEQADFFREQDRAVIAKGGITINEVWITFADDGHRELVETTKAPMFDGKGRLIGVLGIGHDITERKCSEEALRLTEEASRNMASMLRLMCDNVPDMIWAKDLEKRYLFANKAFCEQLLNAQDVGEPVGKTDLYFALRERARHPEVANWHTFGELCQDSDTLILQNGEPGVFEEFGNVKGKYKCLEVHKSPFFNERGEIIGTVGSARDVTDRKRIEDELEQHRQHLAELVERRSAELLQIETKASQILQSSADGLYGVDGEGLITFVNPAACRMLGYREAEAVGRCAHALFHHHRPDGSDYPIEECPGHRALFNNEETRVDHEVYWHADGHAIPVMYAIHPTWQNGRNTGAVVSFVDISAQRAAAAAQEQALNAAEHLAQMKSEFLANMSHEIRTPLNGVLGFAQIGYRNFQDRDQAFNAFEKILSSGQRLLGVVNDILDFSKIEAGKMSIAHTETSLSEIIEQSVDLIRDRALAKGLELKVIESPDLPHTCLSDPLRIGQILLNLLSNAVKFTDSGSVTLRASRTENELVFRIIDTGIGIDNALLDRLFNPFQQADGSSTRRFDGTGLGLAISKRILELMDGRIDVESQPGVGSVFEFRLPYVEPTAPVCAAPADSAAPPRPLRGLRILVAEYDAISRMVLEHNLAEDGANVVMVGSGDEALKRILDEGTASFDLILMDVHMPGMDGCEAARRILELAPGLLIIGLTAYAADDDRQHCLAAGMVDQFARPVDPHTLTAAILRTLSCDAAG